jgi:hypothetical protein
MVVTWKELGLGLLYGAWLSVEKCRALHTVFEIQLTPHPLWNYVKLEGVHKR